MFHGTLKDLPALEHRDDLDGPVMVVIGDAVAGAEIDKAEPLAAQNENAVATAATLKPMLPEREGSRS